MKKHFKHLLCLFLVIALLSGCEKKANKNTKLDKVKVAQFGEVFLYMPLYIAQSKGFFEEEGIEIELTNTGGDDKTFAAVISGSATFGVADPTFVAIANEKGIKGRVIAGVVNGVPFWGITKNKDIQPFTESKQIAGYKVATFPSPSTAYALQYDMFKDASLTPNIRQAAFGTLLPLLETGEVDIALELEPNVSTAVQNGAKVLYSMSDLYGDFAITGVTVSDETAKQNAGLIQRFVNALEKAENYSHAHPDSAIGYAQKKFPDLDAEIVKQAMTRMIDSKTLPESVLISSKAWDKAISLRKDVGDIISMDKAREVLDMSFAKKAIEQTSSKSVSKK